MIAAGLVASLLLWAPVALADDTVCQGILGEVTVVNLIVPDGSTCTLNGTRVEGNIHVGTGATLGANGVDVDGNIQAEGAQSVNVVALHGVRSFVGGNIQIKQGGHRSYRQRRHQGGPAIRGESRRGRRDQQ